MTVVMRWTWRRSNTTGSSSSPSLSASPCEWPPGHRVEIDVYRREEPHPGFNQLGDEFKNIGVTAHEIEEAYGVLG
jgi:hypothetical protein